MRKVYDFLFHQKEILLVWFSGKVYAAWSKHFWVSRIRGLQDPEQRVLGAQFLGTSSCSKPTPSPPSNSFQKPITPEIGRTRERVPHITELRNPCTHLLCRSLVNEMCLFLGKTRKQQDLGHASVLSFYHYFLPSSEATQDHFVNNYSLHWVQTGMGCGPHGFRSFQKGVVGCAAQGGGAETWLLPGSAVGNGSGASQGTDCSW